MSVILYVCVLLLLQYNFHNRCDMYVLNKFTMTACLNPADITVTIKNN